MTIKERLGHSSITTTMDRYGHLLPSLDEAVADGLDAVLRESETARRRHVEGSGVAVQEAEVSGQSIGKP